MSDHAKENKSSINWGGLCKGLLAGAAVVAGVMIVCGISPTSAVEGIKSLGNSLVTPATTTGVVESNWMKDGIGWMVAKAAGIAAVVMGTSYLLSDKKDHSEERHAHHREAHESFAIREDMRKMQAVMQMRMQAAGVQNGAARA